MNNTRVMKKFVSFVAAMAIMTSGASALATDVNAAAYNYNYATARASTTKASSTKELVSSLRISRHIIG